MSTELTFRNSSVSDFIVCPARYFFAWYMNLTPMDLNIDLEFGASMHLGMETYFLLIKECHPQKEAARRAIETFMDDFNSKDLDTHASKNTLNGVELLSELFSKFSGLEPGQIIAVEKRFSKRLKGYTYTGKLDLLLKQRGRLVAYDHKTAGRLDGDTASKWQLSRQFIGYQFLSGADEFIVNVLHCVQPTGKPRVFQLPFLFSKFKLDCWQYQTIKLLDDIAERLRLLKEYEKAPRFPYVPDALFPRLGTKCGIYRCGFEPLCNQDLPLTEVIVPRGMYKERGKNV